MDRNDRRHLLGFHELIARGQMHNLYGGPDHIDAAPVTMKSKEPVGTVFGCIDPIPSSRQMEVQSDMSDYTCRPNFGADQMVPQMFGTVETDSGPVVSRGLTNLNVDPVRASLVTKQWNKQQDILQQSCDSGYSGSLNSANSINSRDETEIQLASGPSLTQTLQNLSIDKEANYVNDIEKQKLQERVSITSSDEEPNLGSINSLQSDSASAVSSLFNVDSPNSIEEYTAKFKRNLKYFEQDQDYETNLHHLLYADRDDLVLQFLDDLINSQLLDVCNKAKQTILHVATIMNKPILVRAIMVHGAPVDLRDSKGNTALHIASQKGFMECVEVLTKHLTYDEVKYVSYQVPFRSIPQCMELKNYEGLTCLHLAALNNHFDIVHYLVHDLRADVNSLEGKRGMTPLVCCVEKRNAQMLMYLVQQCKANIHVRTYDRKNAYELAMGRGFREIANLLKSIDPEVESPEEEDWIEEDFDDFTMNGQPVSM